jgi:hypothetical protein
MPSANSTVRVLCLVPAIAVARNASAGSAHTDSCQPGAANVSCSSAQLLVSHPVVNFTSAKISSARVDLLDPRGRAAPYGSISAISLFSGSPTQITGSFHPRIDL